jgi:protein-glutamine gamma-glutamyltransferase
LDNKVVIKGSVAIHNAQVKVPQPIRSTFEYALLGMLAAGYLALLGSHLLDWPVILLGGSGLILRGLMTAGVVSLHVPGRVAGALALVYTAFFPVDWHYVSGNSAAATVHMVFFLAVLKLITARTARDYGYLKVIAGLEIAAAAVISGGASFLLYLAIFLLCAIVAYASGEVYRGAAGPSSISRVGLPVFSRRLGLFSTALFAGVLLLSAGMFIVLPRTARAVFARFGPPRMRLAGFSSSVTLGEIGKLKTNDTPVMHVRSFQNEGFLPVKWRGSALTDFDGTRWFNPAEVDQVVAVDNGVIALRNAVVGTRQGRNLIYQARLSPVISDTLFFAGNPETIRIDVPFLRYAGSGIFHVPPRFGTRGLNYSVYGFLPDEWAEVRFTSAPLAGPFRERLLKLPTIDPRIPQLAQTMTLGKETEVEKARAIEAHLRHDYGYTLDLLSQPVADPLAYFLFDRKKGHCEYFASSMAVLLRTIGIPSRVVTGFESGTYNTMTGWQVVRASDAHSWVEAWLDGRGWTTFDPTPPDTSAAVPGLLSKFSMLTDAVDQVWQDWVVSYDVDRQIALVTRMRDSGSQLRFPRFDDLGAALGKFGAGIARWATVFGALALALAAWMLTGPSVKRWWQHRAHTQRIARGQTERSDATILYERFLRLLEKRGVSKPPWLTPMEFVKVLRTPDLAALAAEATTAYNDLRFGGQTEAAARLTAAIEKLERYKPHTA